MARRPRIAIVGCGRAGGSIGLALQRAGYEISGVWSASRAGRQRAAALLDAPVFPEPSDAARTAGMVIVAVPDDHITEIAEAVAPGVRGGVRVAHTSGATSVEALAPVRELGGRIGSLHPLQTLPDPRRGAEALQGAAVAVTCDPGDHAYLSRIASGWGGRPFRLPDEAKVLYHAAAVFASNSVAACLWAAGELLREAGVRGGPALLRPLVEATVDNVSASGPRRALTGPVVRGDLDALRRHVEALDERSDDVVCDAYRALAKLTAAAVQRDLAAIEEAVG